LKTMDTSKIVYSETKIKGAATFSVLDQSTQAYRSD
jgi:hypothetical protein